MTIFLNFVKLLVFHLIFR